MVVGLVANNRIHLPYLCSNLPDFMFSCNFIGSFPLIYSALNSANLIILKLCHDVIMTMWKCLLLKTSSYNENSSQCCILWTLTYPTRGLNKSINYCSANSSCWQFNKKILTDTQIEIIKSFIWCIFGCTVLISLNWTSIKRTSLYLKF